MVNYRLCLTEKKNACCIIVYTFVCILGKFILDYKRKGRFFQWVLWEEYPETPNARDFVGETHTIWAAKSHVVPGLDYHFRMCQSTKVWLRNADWWTLERHWSVAWWTIECGMFECKSGNISDKPSHDLKIELPLQHGIGRTSNIILNWFCLNGRYIYVQHIICMDPASNFLSCSWKDNIHPQLRGKRDPKPNPPCAFLPFPTNLKRSSNANSPGNRQNKLAGPNSTVADPRTKQVPQYWRHGKFVVEHATTTLCRRLLTNRLEMNGRYWRSMDNITDTQPFKNHLAVH